MFVYWGRNNGGKLHMRFLTKMNSQTLVITEDQMIIKEKYTVKNRGVSPDGRLWIDSIIDGKIYYRLDEKSLKLHLSEFKDHNVRKLHFYANDAYINPYQVQREEHWYKKPFRKWFCPEIFTPEDRKKILENFENKNTVLNKSALLEQRNFCVELGYIPLNLNAKKIFHDVDIILVDVYDTFEQKISVGNYEIPPQLLNILRESTNIVPINSNLLDHFISLLDSFSHHTLHKYYETPVEMYEKNKNILWDYLDTQVGQVHKIVKSLEFRKIPYQYFDLDTDSYTDVFGYEYDLPRDYTSHAFTWKDHMDRHAELEEIAKEYITLRNITTMKP